MASILHHNVALHSVQFKNPIAIFAYNSYPKTGGNQGEKVQSYGGLAVFRRYTKVSLGSFEQSNVFAFFE